MNKYFNIGFLILFLLSDGIVANPYYEQEIPLSGTPSVTHFTKEDFNADPQFWAACEDEKGIMYFGNNDGVLIYDGERWKKLFLPNNSSVRCLATDQNGIVYAGGYNEFGTINRNEFGKFEYNSLIDTLQLKNENFENAWRIHPLKGEIVIRTFKELISINNNKAVLLPAKHSFINSYVADNILYVQDKGEGIFIYDQQNGNLKKLLDPEKYNGESIVSITSTENSNDIILLSQTGILYLYDHSTGRISGTNSIIDKNDLVVNAVRNGKHWIIGTLNSRVMTYDLVMKEVIQKNKFHNIRDEAIHNLYLNHRGNLWVMMNNGLDFIKMNAPVKTIFDEASAYDVAIFNESLYIATNQGVYHAKLTHESDEYSSGDFNRTGGLEGQVWTFTKTEQSLLINHDKGLYQYHDGIMQKIDDVEGIWKTIKIRDRDQYLVCTYNGIYLTREAQGTFQIIHKINGFNESSRDIIPSMEENTYWICHGYKGVYRIKMDENYERVVSLEHFTDRDGLPSPYNINAHYWNEKIVFTTNQGIYTFNTQRNKFEPFEPLNDILGRDQNIREIVQQGDTSWFVKDDALGYFTSRNPDLIMDPFATFKGTFNRGLELIRPITTSQVLIGTRNGLFIYDFNYMPLDKVNQTIISEIEYAHDTITSYLPIGNDVFEVPNNFRQIRISYCSPGLIDQYDVTYSYKLENVDRNWSTWTSTPFVEYNHLPPGDYRFMVKSKSAIGGEGKMTGFSFHVRYRWYQTVWAWAVFILLGIFIIGFIVYWVKHKISSEKQKTRQEEMKARKLLELEIQQLKLTKEKERISMAKQQLEEDMIYQSKELANYTMLLVKKREVFSEIRTALRELLKKRRTEGDKQEIRKLIKTINQNMSNEKHMKVFEANFEHIHGDFFKTLTEQYPDLTQRELRLCAFIKMNLSNKEISPLLNISIRGVESARYRLRKKLAIDHEENLVEFLQKSYYENKEPQQEER